MYYEINISLNGKHLFATARRSITTENELVQVNKIFQDKFPQQEGYSITITHHPEIGSFVQICDKHDKVYTEKKCPMCGVVEKVLQTSSKIYYRFNNTIFSIWEWKERELSDSDIFERMSNAAKYIPDYIPDSFEKMKNKPLAIFEIEMYEVKPYNMSLYEYDRLIKGKETTHKALQSAFIQQEYDYLTIACEPFDCESELTPRNKRIIEDYVNNNCRELLNITYKTDYTIEFYE